MINFKSWRTVRPSLTLFFEPLAVQPYKARVSMSQKHDLSYPIPVSTPIRNTVWFVVVDGEMPNQLA